MNPPQSPLALCSSDSVDYARDVATFEVRYAERIGENWFGRAGEGARERWVRGREGRSEGAREEGKKDEGGGREGKGGRTRMRREEGTTGAMAVTAVGV